MSSCNSNLRSSVNSTSSDSTASDHPSPPRKLVQADQLPRTSPSPVEVSSSAFPYVNIQSKIIQEDLVKFRNLYAIPEEFDLLVPDEASRAHLPPPGHITIYKQHLEAGLRFPLPNLFVEILNKYNVSPGQLVPNSWRIMVGYFVMMRRFGFEPDFGTFSKLVCLKKFSSTGGYYYFSPHPSRKFLDGLPSSHKMWKPEFLFVGSHEKWPFLEGWSNNVVRYPEDKDLDPHFNHIVDVLTKKVFSISKIVKEPVLVLVGLSPAKLEVHDTLAELLDHAPKRPLVEDSLGPCNKYFAEVNGNGKPLSVCSKSKFKTSFVDDVDNKVGEIPQKPNQHDAKEAKVSRSLLGGVNSFPGKFVPDWPICVSDSALENPHVSEAFIRGMHLERDKQVLDKQNIEVTASNFFHELGKAMLHAGSVRDYLAEQTTLTEKSEERAKFLEARISQNEQHFSSQLEKLHKKIDELKADKEKLLVETTELTKRSDELLQNEVELSKKLSAKDHARREEIDNAVAAFKASSEVGELVKKRFENLVNEFKKCEEYKGEIIGLSMKQYKNGFEDCKKQLKDKLGGNWDFLMVDEFEGSTPSLEVEVVEDVHEVVDVDVNVVEVDGKIKDVDEAK